jgi:predicted nucleic acid-binding protein
MGTKRTQAAQTGVTLDTGALIALERGDRRMIALLREVLGARGRFRVPAGVVAQAWRDGRRQGVLRRFLRLPQVEIRVLDEPFAMACGELATAAGVSDVIDASVVLTAREHRDPIVTSDAHDLRRLDRSVRLETV